MRQFLNILENRLNELFDKSAKLIWKRQTEHIWAGEIKYNDYCYWLIINSGMVVVSNRQTQNGDPYQDGPEPTFGETIDVWGAVFKGIKEYIEIVHPYMVHFEASHASRMKLYVMMLKRHKKELQALGYSLQQHGPEFVLYNIEMMRAQRGHKNSY